MTHALHLLGALALPLAATAASPYIANVYEYCPAPGQFVNSLPEYEPGDDYDTILEKTRLALVGDRQPGAITLGAFGGYVTFGFDHTIVNVAGTPDFTIYGNAIISDLDSKGGSCEPGIVWVSRDVNANGLPDDPWYRIAGSEDSNPLTIKHFSVTYTRPAEGHIPTPGPTGSHITDSTYIPWSASDGSSGHLAANDYNPTPYWPQWLDDTTIERSGMRLPGNMLDINGDGSYYLLLMFDYGYADNCPNSRFEGFDIDDAVNDDGTPALLSGIDFVRVVTGQLQQCGRLGETSTEVCGAEDLHPDAASVQSLASPSLLMQLRGHTLHISSPLPQTVHGAVISMQGTRVATLTLTPGASAHDLGHLPAGIYLLATPGAETCRIVLP